MNVKYRLLVPSMMNIFCLCAVLAKLEMRETTGIFSIVFCALFLWVPSLIKRFLRINIPAIFEYTGICQMFACIALGSGLGFYYLFPAWDIIAHTVSGTLWSFGALWFLYICRQKLNDWMLILYSFLFSTTTSVLWEIYEFLADRIRDASDMQRAKFVSSGVEGVMDTMTDLICNFVGCIIFIGIFIYDKKKKESAIMINFENECNRIKKEENEEDLEVYGE